MIGIHSQGKKVEKRESNKGYFIHKPINEFLQYIGDTPNMNDNETQTPKGKKDIKKVKDSSKEKKLKKEEKENNSLNIMNIIYRASAFLFFLFVSIIFTKKYNCLRIKK